MRIPMAVSRRLTSAYALVRSGADGPEVTENHEVGGSTPPLATHKAELEATIEDSCGILSPRCDRRARRRCRSP